MRSKCPLKINRQYWLFFCITAIIPFLVLSFLLWATLALKAGDLVVPYWASSLIFFIQDSIYLLPVFALFILGFLILLGGLFNRNIIKPVISLANISQELAQDEDDEFKTRINLYTYCNDEIAMIANNFNLIMERLEETEQLRSTFITTLTHDLRTPILAQQRVMEILDNEILTLTPLEQKNLIDGLLENNNNLLTLVNMVLETYQYEKGNIILDYRTVSLPNLINESVSELKTLAESNNISILNNIGYNIPLFCADPRHLKRVFNNLIGNAIQNIPKNCKVEVSGEIKEGFIEIRVKDNGQGIPEVLLPNMFKRYSSGHKIRKKIGSGLGLYICKMIVEMHEGTIRVESKPDAGTCFYIRLPLVNPCCSRNKQAEGEQWKPRCHNCSLKSA